MRKWTATPPHAGARPVHALAGMIGRLGQPEFAQALLDELHPLVPAASCSVYQTGAHCVPQLYFSASRGVPDTTVDCWRAYLAGPYRSDRSLVDAAPRHEAETLLCHTAAQDVPAEHRARVYEAHGVAERVSVVRQRSDGALFAVNFYRHEHQSAFSDGQIADFEALAPALLALVQKQVALAPLAPAPLPAARWRDRLLQAAPGLTERELDVCARLLRGMTQQGIAADLGLTVPTVKTYRNRAFDRLGIHFRNELFGVVSGAGLH